jgi:hypothetical protein
MSNPLRSSELRAAVEAGADARPSGGRSAGCGHDRTTAAGLIAVVAVKIEFHVSHGPLGGGLVGASDVVAAPAVALVS